MKEWIRLGYLVSDLYILDNTWIDIEEGHGEVGAFKTERAGSHRQI